MASARELYEDWKASGDTQREVAERHGMNYNTARRKIGDYQREMEGVDDDDIDEARDEARLARFLREQGIEPGAEISGAWVKDESLSVYVKMPPDSMTFEEVVDKHIARIQEAAPVYHVPTMANSGTVTAIIQVYDAHLGKLSIDETYTLDRQVEDFIRAVDGALAYCKRAGYHVGKFIFPVGNDTLHVDTMHHTTTKGTLVETSTSPLRMFDAAVEALHESIRRMAAVAPVDVLNVPGNHDYLSSHHLVKVMEASFAHHDGVTVDTGHAPRKYRRVGPTSLMFLHGESVPLTSYPGQFLMEAGELCGGAPYYVVMKGHLHKRGGTYQVITEDNGVQARTIPSLCKTDQYHLLHGYGAQRAAEVHVFDNERGPAGIFPVFPHELQTLSDAALAAD